MTPPSLTSLSRRCISPLSKSNPHVLSPLPSAAPRFTSKEPSTLITLATFAIILLNVARPIESHGLMCSPRQRGAYVSQKCGYDLKYPSDPVIDYCAHCLNGGTVATVKGHLPKTGWHLYEPIKYFDRSGRRAGLCGDPKGSYAHMIGGDFLPTSYKNVPIVAHYKTNGYVDFVAEIDTNHNGYFEYFLCDLDKCKTPDIEGKCFKQGHCYKLQRVKHPDCENPKRNTHYECGPVDETYPGRWYLPCRNTGHVGVHIVGGPTGTMRYALPKDVKCKHCVIQWYWATANSCAPRGVLNYMHRKNNPFGRTCESDGGGRGTYRDGMTTCGGEHVPEEFWSCADVQITDDGKSVGAVKAVGKPMTKKERSEEERLKRNPKKVLEEASDELKKDIQSEIGGGNKERRREEAAAERGECLLEGTVCDGSVKCCDWQQVCVFSATSSSFSCRFWWSLWQEAELRLPNAHKK